jgi:hypothetical protein
VIPVSKRANLLVIRLTAASWAAEERLDGGSGARKARAAAVAFFPGAGGYGVKYIGFGTLNFLPDGLPSRSLLWSPMFTRILYFLAIFLRSAVL